MDTMKRAAHAAQDLKATAARIRAALADHKRDSDARYAAKVGAYQAARERAARAVRFGY